MAEAAKDKVVVVAGVRGDGGRRGGRGYGSGGGRGEKRWRK